MTHVALGRLSKKISIVTGGGSGIGAAIARMFAAEGSKVVIAELDPVAGARVAKEIESAGGTAFFVKTDVSSESDVQNAIRDALEKWGGIDVLVNNAGIGIEKTAEQSSIEEWNHIMGVNARGTFLLTKYVIPHMRARSGGSIINIGSLFALRGAPSHAIYHATKGAIRQLTKSTALTLAPEGIRVNAVHPGVIETPGAVRDATAAKYMGPMQRWGRAEEIAYGCVFLASDESKFITGIDLPIDGGLSV
jgi:cyclopentanol dehydrogenase